ATVVVLRSTMVRTRGCPADSPSGPRHTCCTWGPPGKERKTMSARAATSLIELARCALVSLNKAKAASLRSNAMTSPACLRATLRHIGPPITPSPMKPIVAVLSAAMVCSLVHPHAAADIQRGARDPVGSWGTEEEGGLGDIFSLSITAKRYRAGC